MLPKISVVTPSLNQGSFIGATLHSIHDQEYPNLEHILMDGGSTDETLDVVDQFDDRIAYRISAPDDGQADALGKGFSVATGDIFCWLNSDDLFTPTTLWEVADYFERNTEARFVYGNSRWIDADGRLVKPKLEHRWNRFVWLYDHNFVPQPSAFWRADLYDEVGGVDTSFELAMDADLWIRFADRTRPRHHRSVWSSMRIYPAQKNTRLRAEGLREMALIRSQYGKPLSGPMGLARSISARAMRVLLKLVSGGYPPREVARHLPHLARRGSWEEDVYASSDDTM